MEPQQTTIPVSTSAPEQNSQPVPATTSRFPKKRIAAFVAGILVAILGYILYTYAMPHVAATVNGTRITEAELQENVALMTKTAELQGVDVSDPAAAAEIRRQALENLINNELLIGAARTSGLTSNEAAVQSAYDTLVTELGGEEALKSRMETVGLTSETLMGNISDRLIVDQYIESVTDIENLTITEEEVKAYLSSINIEGVALPPLEEIRPQIEATLLAQKQQALVDELLKKLRSEATIEIK